MWRRRRRTRRCPDCRRLGARWRNRCFHWHSRRRPHLEWDRYRLRRPPLSKLQAIDPSAKFIAENLLSPARLRVPICTTSTGPPNRMNVAVGVADKGAPRSGLDQRLSPVAVSMTWTRPLRLVVIAKMLHARYQDSRGVQHHRTRCAGSEDRNRFPARKPSPAILTSLQSVETVRRGRMIGSRDCESRRRFMAPDGMGPTKRRRRIGRPTERSLCCGQLSAAALGKKSVEVSRSVDQALMGKAADCTAHAGERAKGSRQRVPDAPWETVRSEDDVRRREVRSGIHPEQRIVRIAGAHREKPSPRHRAAAVQDESGISGEIL